MFQDEIYKIRPIQRANKPIRMKPIFINILVSV